MPRPARMCPKSLDDGVSLLTADDEDCSGVVCALSGECNNGSIALDLSCSSVAEENFFGKIGKKRAPCRAGSLADRDIGRAGSLADRDIGRVGPSGRVWWQRHHPHSPMPNCSATTGPRKMMPRVVDNQREKFEGDAVFRRLSRESEVRYAGLPIERPIEQRRRQFEADLNNGFLIMSFLTSGTHIMLTFRNPRNVPEVSAVHDRDLSAAEIRNGLLFIQSKMMLNGVCVIWNGHIDMETLDGLGRLEFDAAAAEAEVGRGQGGAQRRQ